MMQGEAVVKLRRKRCKRILSAALNRGPPEPKQSSCLLCLCGIQRRDLSVGTDFYGGGWLVSSPGETAAIWIYSSTFALFWLFHFLAHSCELGRLFFLKEAERLVFQTGFLGDRISNLT